MAAIALWTQTTLRRAHSPTAGIVANFVTRAPGIRILDYGGGNGRLAQHLVARGLNASSWDVMAADQHRPLAGNFDLVTCFEVMEHTTTPIETFAEILSFLTPGE